MILRPKGLDVFIYLRKSRKDQEEEERAAAEGRTFDTLERHRNQLLELAKHEGHNVLATYEEVVSGENIMDRPQIQKMLRQIEKGRVEGVMVMDLDRLGRGDMFDMGMIYRTFHYSETKIITPTEVIDPAKDGSELIFGIKSIISREELKAITKRMQRGRHASAREGKFMAKRAPYGYMKDENLRLVPDPETAPVVVKIFEMIAEGKGRNTIAKELTMAGIPPPSKTGTFQGRGDAKEWNGVTISKILHNEAYLGRVVWGSHRHIRAGKRHSAIPLPPEKWTRKENAHEPIITKELWDRAHANYGKKAPRVKKGKKLVNVLAGILFCENCGYTMTHKREKGGSYFECRSIQCRGVVRSISGRLLLDRLLEVIEFRMKEFEADNKAIKQESSSIIPFQKGLEAKEKELQQLLAQKDTLHNLLEQGVYDIPTFAERNKKLTDKIKGIENEINEIKEVIVRKEEEETKQREVIPKLKTVLEAYHETDDIEKKNMLFKSIIDQIEYSRPKGSKFGEFTIDVTFRF